VQAEQRFPDHYFARYDENDDQVFYRYPRLTVHIDDAAIDALGKLFNEELPVNGTILDLMSSYRSHLPADIEPKHVVGLGLNEDELRLNPQLNEYHVHDLNREPALPFADAAFDAAVCTVSVQYLTRPVEVFAEIGRVLKPGAPFVVSFSNRCFPSKAVQVWVHTGDKQHVSLVRCYFEYAGCFEHIRTLDRSPRHWISDPLYAVVGRRVV
jgi:SAM-dependent methyltransferase